MSCSASAAAEVLQALGPEESGPALTAVAERGAPRGSRRGTARRPPGQPAPTRFAVIGMGRFGGRELGLGQRPRCALRPRAATGCRRRGGVTLRDHGRDRAAATAHGAGRRAPAAARRRPATGGTQRRRSCARSRRTAPTTTGGRSPGRARRCFAPAPIAGDSEVGNEFTALIDALRWPDRGLSTSGGHRDPTDQGAGRVRAASAGSRPRAAHQARDRADWPTSSGRCSCCRCSTGSVPSLRTTATLEALAAAERGGWSSAVRTRTSCGRRGCSPPRYATPSWSPRVVRRTAFPR